MYAVLTMALAYTLVPLMHMLVLDFERTPFEMESEQSLTGDVLGTWGEDGFIMANVSESFTNTTVDITAWDASNGYAAPVWTMTHPIRSTILIQPQP